MRASSLPVVTRSSLVLATAARRAAGRAGEARSRRLHLHAARAAERMRSDAGRRHVAEHDHALALLGLRLLTVAAAVPVRLVARGVRVKLGLDLALAFTGGTDTQRVALTLVQVIDRQRPENVVENRRRDTEVGIVGHTRGLEPSVDELLDVSRQGHAVLQA